MSDTSTRSRASNSPVVIVLAVVAMFGAFATLAWLGARRESAALYGFVRAIEFPFLNRLAPYSAFFELENIRKGAVPSFSMIYWNSFAFGLVFTALILALMMAALLRLERFSILQHVTIKASKGRTPHEIMARLARDEPSVQFFLDHDVLGLPTNEGTARQPWRAIELLLLTDSIRHIELSRDHSKPPALQLDNQRLRSWLSKRFGPVNPFAGIARRRLLDQVEIDAAVDDLSWPAVLILYPALWRIHAFHVEGPEGFVSVQAGIDTFIDSIWIETNSLKKEFGDGLALGFASPADREERNALYRTRLDAAKAPRRAKPRRSKLRWGKKVEPEPQTFDSLPPSTALDGLSDLARVHRLGRVERGEVEPDAHPGSSPAGSRPVKGGKKGAPPENLLFFSEVMSERGPNLASVAEARAKLKELLKRHLGVQTGFFPVGTDAKTGCVRYDKHIRSAEEKAFNTRAQDRLARAQIAIERVLWGHHYEFSAVGGAVELARRYGILPPNLFRWMRFCDETAPLWWFVQNLGMPAAYPENAGHYEHYQAEKAIGVAIEQPFIEAAIDGLRQEAERYLVPERVDELRTILGKDAIVSTMLRPDALEDFMPEFERITRTAAQAARAVQASAAAREDAGRAPKTSSGAIPRGKALPPEEPPARRVVARDALLNEFSLDD